MTDKDSHSIRNEVIAAVLGGVILAALAYLVPAVKAFFLWLWTLALQLVALLAHRYSLPGWGLLVLALLLLCVPTIVRVLSTVSPGYVSYVEDTIYGAKWRWEWSSNQISRLWCYCPICDSELVYDDSTCRDFLAQVKKTDFICEHCARRVVASIVGGDLTYALSAVEREIRRKVRTAQIPESK